MVVLAKLGTIIVSKRVPACMKAKGNRPERSAVIATRRVEQTSLSAHIDGQRQLGGTFSGRSASASRGHVSASNVASSLVTPRQ